jgi:hypothetical protein
MIEKNKTIVNKNMTQKKKIRMKVINVMNLPQAKVSLRQVYG